MSTYDVIVIGVGGMGSMVCLELSRRGAHVLGLEQHQIGHALGSSHGETRLIRRAYFEAPGYVPLVDRAYALWRGLEAATGRELLVESGLLIFGAPGGSVIAGAERAGREHGLAFERLTVAEAAPRFPDFRAPADWDALFEKNAGFLRVDDCVRAAVDAARERGARIREGTRVTAVHAEREGVRVETSEGTFEAASVVLTAGPWSAAFAGALAPKLTVRRKLLFWLRADAEAHRLDAGAPCFAFDTPAGFFYGFPALEPGVVKLAEHSGGRDVGHPDTIDRELHPEDFIAVERFVTEHLPRVTPQVSRHRVCMYTMTPDEHFIVGRHPGAPRTFVGAGFSGHGFKFASVVGRALAELALEGETQEPIGFLSGSRFGKS